MVGHEHPALINRITALLKEARESSPLLPLHKHTVRSRQSATGRVLTTTRGHPDLIPRLQSMRSEGQLLTKKYSGLWCFVTATVTETDPVAGCASRLLRPLDVLSGNRPVCFSTTITNDGSPGAPSAYRQPACSQVLLFGDPLVLCSHSCTDSARSLPNSVHGLCYAHVFFSLWLDHCLPRAIALSVPWPAMNWWAAALSPVSLLFNLGLLGLGRGEGEEGVPARHWAGWRSPSSRCPYCLSPRHPPPSDSTVQPPGRPRCRCL